MTAAGTVPLAAGALRMMRVCTAFSRQAALVHAPKPPQFGLFCRPRVSRRVEIAHESDPHDLLETKCEGTAQRVDYGLTAETISMTFDLFEILLVAAVFIIAGIVKGVVWLGLPAIAMRLLGAS
jgi:hypothetical protein